MSGNHHDSCPGEGHANHADLPSSPRLYQRRKQISRRSTIRRGSVACASLASIRYTTDQDERNLRNFVLLRAKRGLVDDSFGEIFFSGFGCRNTTAPYIRVTKDVDPAVLWTLMTKYWRMDKPNLIVSVIGGEETRVMRDRVWTGFYRGLVEALQSTGAWLLTGGMDKGVIKELGQAVRSHANSIAGPGQVMVNAVGVAVWGAVAGRASLQGDPGHGLFPAVYTPSGLQTNGPTLPLNLNHTHFILVDDGTDGTTSGADIAVRSRLEEYISQQSNNMDVKVPAVLLVIDGDARTMHSTRAAIERKTPTVIIDGSGGAADLIAQTYRRKQCDLLTLEDMYLRLVHTYGLEQDTDGGLTPQAEEQLTELWEDLTVILAEDKLVTIFRLRRGDAMNVDKALLQAVLKAKSAQPESQLKLAISLNRSDIVQTNVFTPENRAEWQAPEREAVLYRAMETALLQDRQEFVQLLLDNGVDLTRFLTVRRLHGLYSKALKGTETEARVEVIGRLVERARGKTWFLGNRLHSEDLLTSDDLLDRVGHVVCTKLLGDRIPQFYKHHRYILKDRQPSDNDVTFSLTVDGEGSCEDIFSSPVRELFLWAVLMDKMAVATLMWRIGTDQIAAALTASKVLQSLADIARNEEQLNAFHELTSESEQFERYAVGVIDECYRQNKSKSYDLLVRRSEEWGNITCMEIANSAGHMDFMSHVACQTKLNKIWKGRMALYTPWWMIVLSLYMPFVFFIKFVDDTEEYENEVQINTLDRTKKRQSKIQEVTKNLMKVTCGKGHDSVPLLKAILYYHRAPVTRFCYSVGSYILFLVLFSLFVMTDLDGSISPLEGLLFFYMFCLLLEEIRQVVVQKPQNVLYKVRNWMDDKWNQVDFILLTCFFTSFTLHWSMGDTYIMAARTLYCITLILTYVRLLQLFLVQEDVGPKILMIKGMMRDLGVFMFILVAFILSYGVTRQALQMPNSPVDWTLLFNVTRVAYWHIYGELFVDEEEGYVPGPWYVSILQAAYMLVSNVLLLNLLIAMFNFTFQKIQDNSEQVWRFHRYELIYEYFDRPFGPPPFIILGHLWRLGRFLRRLRKGEVQESSNDFSRIFDSDKVQCLQNFEKLCAENYFQLATQKQPDRETELVRTIKRLEEAIERIESRDDQGRFYRSVSQQPTTPQLRMEKYSQKAQESSGEPTVDEDDYAVVTSPTRPYVSLSQGTRRARPASSPTEDTRDRNNSDICADRETVI